MTSSTLLFNSTDLRSITGVVIEDISGVYAPGTRRSSDDVIPGQRGVLAATNLVYDQFQFSIPVSIGAATEATLHDAIDALAAVVVTSTGLGPLERRLQHTSGLVAATASGRFVGFSGWTRDNDVTVGVELVFANLDGAWKRSSDNVWVVP